MSLPKTSRRSTKEHGKTKTAALFNCAISPFYTYCITLGGKNVNENISV